MKLPKHLVFVPRYSFKKEVQCFICNETLELRKMRNHVGRHILWTLRGQTDPTIISGQEVSGFI